ncbi:arylsulfatase A [Algoriphagus boseongensis]|uniref:Arylsulfatase A n=1 Tax=Algoriphagus boseongensis TaxID=1442587 RepID=A0A4R6T5L7_9BACT|nr:arylsulfatase [Algoriphagus boseongensis]TDQ16942.1 arylsulfatase A [Algoriphagus boseongensis]
MRSSIFVFLIAMFVFSSCKEEKAIPPNIVLILTDDQGYGDLGVHGNEVVKTPNLDRLAGESARFDRFYVSPLCAPTRASLLTGRYHLRTGVVSVSKGLETMNAEEYTLAEMLRDQGYATGIFGKWHNGQHYPNHPLAQGFDKFTGFSAGHWSNYFNTHLEKNGKEKSFEGYLPDVLTEEALDFIRKNKDQPFFTYLSINTPHSPNQVPDEYFLPYKNAGLDDELAAIYGMVSNLDWNIGRVLNLLEELGLDENTLVIFLTDNGPNGQRFNGEMKGIKGSVHEGGVRVPSFWRWKGKITSQLISTPAAHIDVLPTLADLIGVREIPGKPKDGVSLAPLFEGEEIPQRSIFSHVAQLDKELKERPGAIRKDSLLLTLLPNGSELYDLKNDPKQLVNLAPSKVELVNALEKEYQDWWQEVTVEIEMDRQIPISNLTPEIVLPTYEAELKGDLKFFEGHGWAQDWVTNWKNESDSLVWNLNVIDSGEFEVWLEYSAAPNQLGAELSLSTSSTTLTQTLDLSFEPIQIPSPDRVPRKEAPEQTWNRILLGQIQLAVGKEKLTLSAKKIPSEGLGDVFSVRLLPKNK